MLVLFSQLKKYLPDLKADVQEVASVFTATGQMLDKLHSVTYLGKEDYLMDLEVRQNRADLFGVIGLAKELSSYYNIELIIPKYFEKSNFNFNSSFNGYRLPITIKADKSVKRVAAIKIQNVRIGESPQRLKDYLTFYEINPINNIVDLTNFVMLESGHPSHAFDADKVGNDNLTWEINNGQYSNMISLDQTDIKLIEEALLITNGQRPLALAGLVGGSDSAINNDTKNVLIEMGVYDGGLVRRNSRQMRIITEASSRLEKFMDPDSISEAFEMLVNMILESAGGEIVSELSDNYIQVTPETKINLSISKVNQIGGVEIPRDQIENILTRLGFKILNSTEDLLELLRPQNRLDVEMEEDVIEEVLRIYGYHNIPKDLLMIENTKIITPARLTLIDQITNHLASNGFDEVRSWVLVEEEDNVKTNFQDWDQIKVTNSINEEVPFLRQSISLSLIDQFKNYLKNNIDNIQIFEIGKVFGQKEGKYLEHYSLGMLVQGNNFNSLKNELESLLRSLGIDNISYLHSEINPSAAHPKDSYRIVVQSKEIGIIYLSNQLEVEQCSITEINLENLDELITNGTKSSSTIEVLSKIVDLDVNITLSKNEDLRKYIQLKLKDIDSNIWSWSIIDSYDLGDNVRYTLKIKYTGLSDQDAKKLNSEIFGI
jgi:phenylalanyl-tRNA synthetase beta chain